MASSVCGEYCCLFALYLDRGYSLEQFVCPFDPRTADKQVAQVFTSEFGSSRKKGDLEAVSAALVTKEVSSGYCAKINWNVQND